MAGLARNDIKVDNWIAVSEQRSESSGEKLTCEAYSSHQSEDRHHETDRHNRRLCCSAPVRALRSWVARGKDWGQLLGTGHFCLSAEWRRARKQLCRRWAGYCRQNQRAEGDRCRRPWNVERPAGAAQWTVALPEKSWGQQPGCGPQRYQPGPKYPHPQEGHNEVHGGTGVPAMLGGLGQFPAPVQASKEQKTRTLSPAALRAVIYSQAILVYPYLIYCKLEK